MYEKEIAGMLTTGATFGLKKREVAQQKPPLAESVFRQIEESLWTRFYDFLKGLAEKITGFFQGWTIGDLLRDAKQVVSSLKEEESSRGEWMASHVARMLAVRDLEAGTAAEELGVYLLMLTVRRELPKIREILEARLLRGDVENGPEHAKNLDAFVKAYLQGVLEFMELRVPKQDLVLAKIPGTLERQLVKFQSAYPRNKFFVRSDFEFPAGKLNAGAVMNPHILYQDICAPMIASRREVFLWVFCGKDGVFTFAMSDDGKSPRSSLGDFEQKVFDKRLRQSVWYVVVNTKLPLETWKKAHSLLKDVSSSAEFLGLYAHSEAEGDFLFSKVNNFEPYRHKNPTEEAERSAVRGHRTMLMNAQKAAEKEGRFYTLTELEVIWKDALDQAKRKFNVPQSEVPTGGSRVWPMTMRIFHKTIGIETKSDIKENWVMNDLSRRRASAGATIDALKNIKPAWEKYLGESWVWEGWEEVVKEHDRLVSYLRRNTTKMNSNTRYWFADILGELRHVVGAFQHGLSPKISGKEKESAIRTFKRQAYARANKDLERIKASLAESLMLEGWGVYAVRK